MRVIFGYLIYGTTYVVFSVYFLALTYQMLPISDFRFQIMAYLIPLMFEP